jgi:hypothetical protein
MATPMTRTSALVAAMAESSHGGGEAPAASFRICCEERDPVIKDRVPGWRLMIVIRHGPAESRFNTPRVRAALGRVPVRDVGISFVLDIISVGGKTTGQHHRANEAKVT